MLHTDISFIILIEWSKNGWNDEALYYLKKLNVKNWAYLVKDKTVWYELVQKTKTDTGLYCQQKKKKVLNIIQP
jgi:hypothetical protein